MLGRNLLHHLTTPVLSTQQFLVTTNIFTASRFKFDKLLCKPFSSHQVKIYCICHLWSFFLSLSFFQSASEPDGMQKITCDDLSNFSNVLTDEKNWQTSKWLSEQTAFHRTLSLLNQRSSAHSFGKHETRAILVLRAAMFYHLGLPWGLLFEVKGRVASPVAWLFRRLLFIHFRTPPRLPPPSNPKNKPKAL